ncbi:MAG TPA: vWA domain-containing protein, partial [Planctomycetaceae bacterium]|nr:vWA domain-containing protein [Planctomycetaceae bacterium]
MFRSALQRFVENYLGMPPAQAGERTDWRFEVNGLGSDWLSVAAVTIGALFILYLLYVYRRDAGRGSRRMQALLPGLRLAVIALAFLCLFQFTLSVGRIGLPVIALVIDDSASMGLEDRYPDDKTNELADQLAHAAGAGTKTRIGLTQAILTGDKGQFLRELLEHHKVRLYRFSDAATRLGTRDFAGPGDVAEIAGKIKELKAEGSRTRPGPALRKVLDDFRGSPPAAIILFTDGVASTGDADRLSLAAEAAAASFVPVEAVGIGSEQPSRDLQLYD